MDILDYGWILNFGCSLYIHSPTTSQKSTAKATFLACTFSKTWHSQFWNICEWERVTTHYWYEIWVMNETVWQPL